MICLLVSSHSFEKRCKVSKKIPNLRIKCEIYSFVRQK